MRSLSYLDKKRLWDNIKSFAIVIIIIPVLVTIGYVAIKDQYNKEQEVAQVRADNGGAIPGKELRGSNGGLYNIVTFPEAPGVTCLKQHNMMACFDSSLLTE